MRMKALLLLPLLGVVACDGGSSGDSGKDDTNGPKESVPDYEDGCITVDGEGGYKYIQDAVTVADEGSVILLCNGSYEEAVTVDKGVEILGESREGVTVIAPANAAAFTITGTGASVHTLTIQTSKDGIIFEGSTNSSASDLSINDAPNYAVSFVNATASSLEDCSIYNSLYTGVKISGGSATVARCNFTQSTSTAINVQGGAAATLSDNSFDGVLATTDEDGYAVTVADSTADLSGNTVLSASAGGVYATDSDITSTGDSYTNGTIGVYVLDGDFSGSGLTVTENVVLGLFLVGEGTISLSDSLVTVTDGTLCNNPYSSIWEDGSLACGGVVAAAGTINISNVEVSGYNSYGMYIVTYDGTSTQTISGVNVHDTGRIGMVITPGEGTATISGSTVQGVREPELVEACGEEPSLTGQYSLNNTPALYLLGGTFTLTDNQFLNNAGWGIASSGSTVTMTGTLFDGFGCAGVVNLQGSLNASGNTFTHGDTLGSIWDYQGSTVLANNSFVDNHAWVFYDYGDFKYEFNGAARDIQAGQSAGIVITGNQFTDGDSSILLSDVANVEISDNVWTDYDSEILTIQDSANVVINNNRMSDSYGYFLSAYGTAAPIEVQIEGLTVENNRASESITRYYDGTGAMTDEYISQSTSYETFYLNNASADIVDLTMSGMGNVYYALYFYDASISVDGATMEDGNSFLLGYSYSTPPDLNLQGLEVGALTGSLVQVSNYTASPGALYITDSYVEQASYGVYSSGMMEVEIEDLTIESSTAMTVYLGNSYYDTDGDGVSETLTAPGLTLRDLTITDAAGSAIYAQADLVSIESTHIYSSLSTGVDLTATEVSISDLVVDSAQTDGINVIADFLDIENSEVGTAASIGIDFSGGDMSLATVTVGSAGSYGVYANGNNISLDGIDVDGAGSDGISLAGSSLTVINSYATGLTGNGLSLSGGSADISGNTFSSNGGYGMVCNGVTLTTCATNDLSENALGEHSGCDDSCSAF